LEYDFAHHSFTKRSAPHGLQQNQDFRCLAMVLSGQSPW
jgi:hypothetical protein